MIWKTVFASTGILLFCFGMTLHAAPPQALREFDERAVKFGSAISLPQFEMTPNEVQATLDKTIAAGNAALDKIGALKPREASFANCIRALDDLGYQNALTDNRLTVMKETSTNAAMRDAATEALKKLEEWSVGLDYRLDVYGAVKGYADTKPRLKGEDAKLFEETMRDYRRAGLDLPKEARD